jgi:uncharacterized protein YbaR (Trm112 family)
LRPGGHFFFTDFLSNFLTARPLPRLLESLSLENLPRNYSDYAVRYSIDSADRTGLSFWDYEAVLKTIGFEIERSRTFFGGLLFNYCYLTFDWELMLRDESIWRYRRLHGRALAKLYKDIAAQSLLPLIFDDLHAQTDTQTQIFFHLKKPGQSGANASPPRPVCVRCRGALKSQASALHCAACDAVYPVVSGVPLLFPSAMAAFETARRSKRQAKTIARSVARRIRDRILK